jgi:hypothetical protein
LFERLKKLEQSRVAMIDHNPAFQGRERDEIDPQSRSDE